MGTNHTSPTQDLSAELERLIESESHTERLSRALINSCNDYLLRFPDQSVAIHETIATTLERYLASHPICYAAIQLLKTDRGNHFTDRFVLSVSNAVRAYSSPLGRGNNFHLVLLALEVPALRAASLEACQSILSSPPESTAKRDLREFARELISFFRRCRCDHPLKESVKTLAHHIFTVGQSISLRAGDAGSTTVSHDTDRNSHEEASRILLKLFMQRPPQSTLDRLTGEDFKRVGELSGLTIEEFKVTAEILAQYATKDGGALDAFIRVAKSPHDAGVSVQTRTQALAGFLATSRRRGSLSHEIERQILATSAEIPELPFITNVDTSASEASLD